MGTFARRLTSGGRSSAPRARSRLPTALVVALVAALLAPVMSVASAPDAVAQVLDDVDSSLQTAFTLEPPVGLTVVADALVAANARIVGFSHSSPGHVGGNNSQGLELLEAVARYRADYSELASGEPQISGFNLEGVVTTEELGPLGDSVVERQELDSSAVLAGSDTADSPAAAAVEPAGLFAPAFGRTVTSDASKSPLRRVIIQDMTWESQASIDAMGDESYEHDFKLFNDENTGPSAGGLGTRPLCAPGQGNNFWATRTGTFDTNFPEATSPYFDTDVSDSCKTQDLTIGLVHPKELEPNVAYQTVLRVDAGAQASSPYQLQSEQLERLPGCEDPLCIGLDQQDVDPRQLLIGMEKGNAPECRDWRKGEESERCKAFVDAGPDVSGVVGEPIQLSGSIDDPNGGESTISWDFVPGPGDPVGAQCVFSDRGSVNTTVTCTPAGTYTVTLTADSATGPAVSDSAMVTVVDGGGSGNLPPTVDAGPPASGSSGSPITLSGSVDDPDGDAVAINWSVAATSGCSFSNPTSASTTITCPNGGTYVATLTADDGVNPPVSDTTTVTVDSAPVVDAGPPVSGPEGSPIALSGSVTDPDGDAVAINWSIASSGGADAGAICSFADPSSAATTVTCTDDGNFVATLTASDGTNPSQSDTTTVTVANVAPVVEVTAPVDGVLYGASIHPVTVKAAFDDAGQNDTHTCEVVWGDGTSSAGTVDQGAGTCEASHTFTTAGSYTISVTVTDGEGASGTDTVTVEVRENAIGGGAFGQSVNVTSPLGAVISSGPSPSVILPPEGGGPFTKALASVNVAGLLTASTLDVSTEGQRPGADAFVESSAAALRADIGGGLIVFERIASECRSDGSGSSASTTIVKIVVNGQTLVNLQPAPNTEIGIPGVGVLVLNEQIASDSPTVAHPLGGFTQFGDTSVTVNAAHLKLLPGSPLGTGDIILSQSRCSLEGPAIAPR